MKLVKEQELSLLLEREVLIKARKGLIDSKSGTRAIVNDNQTTDLDYDVILNIGKNSKRVAEISSILELAEIIENPNTDYIDYGSKFTIVTAVKGDESSLEEINATLVEINATADIDQEYISIDSPLGRAIYRKKIGEIFEYTVEASNTTIVGSVMDITKSNVNDKTNTKQGK